MVGAAALADVTRQLKATPGWDIRQHAVGKAPSKSPMPSGISGYKSVDQQMQEWPDKLRKPVSFEKQCKEWPDKLRNSTSPRKMRSTSPPTRTPQPPDFTGDELTGAGSGKVPSPQTGEAWSEGASRVEVPSRSPRRATGVTPGQK